MALRIAVTVKPNAKKSEIVAQGASQFRASVRQTAQGGKANRELIDLLAAHSACPNRQSKSLTVIQRGARSSTSADR